MRAASEDILNRGPVWDAFSELFLDLVLPALAETQEQIHQRLLEITPMDREELKTAWRATAENWLASLPATPAAVPPCRAQFLILVTCRDEKHQVELLDRLGGEGLECRALLS